MVLDAPFKCFNSQPPEGGWINGHAIVKFIPRFQLTAARRRLEPCKRAWKKRGGFNSQPPEGGWVMLDPLTASVAKFQLTAARRRLAQSKRCHAVRHNVSTHSRPKAAGLAVSHHGAGQPVSTHSRPKAAGVSCSATASMQNGFQLTAARRRLGQCQRTAGRL